MQHGRRCLFWQRSFRSDEASREQNSEYLMTLHHWFISIVSVGDVEWYLDCWWFACLRLRKFVEFLSGNFLFSCKKIITVENIYLYFLPTKLNGLPNWMGKSKFCCNAAWGGGLWFCGIFAWALFNGWSTILGIPRCPFGKDSTWKYRATNHQHRH